MHERIANLYDNLVLRRPWVMLALLALGLFVLSPGLRNFKLDASTDALLLESDDALRNFRQVAMRYKTRDFLFVAIVPKTDILADDALEMVSALRDELVHVPQVKDIVSVLDVPLLGRFLPGPTIPVLAAHRVRLDRFASAP